MGKLTQKKRKAGWRLSNREIPGSWKAGGKEYSLKNFKVKGSWVNKIKIEKKRQV